MPYISESDREALSEYLEPLLERIDGLNQGDMNYIITSLIHTWIVAEGGLRYKNLNNAIGILECAKLELYRHICGPYEDKKIEDNGDISV